MFAVLYAYIDFIYIRPTSDVHLSTFIPSLFISILSASPKFFLILRRKKLTKEKISGQQQQRRKITILKTKMLRARLGCCCCKFNWCWCCCLIEYIENYIIGQLAAGRSLPRDEFTPIKPAAAAAQQQVNGI